MGIGLLLQYTGCISEGLGQIGSEKRLRDDLFSVEWDVKRQLNQSTSEYIPTWCHVTPLSSPLVK